ncbi:hypothetical protein QFC19_006487 [Naganishia cerealis]|uniref:Uncharacterized protein n=1 Tax=Naganishia cerealis TaxID=610337 RepID=A0ACC2VGI6_9TREE|nr:hypothetical protein QFC19_006487 [Naganishia cerealis]
MTSEDSPQPSTLKSRLEAFQTPSSTSSASADSQRPRVPSGSLKDRIALFNANAESSKPLIPTAAFGQSAPPPGGPISRTTGGGMIGNRLPKLDPSSAGMLSRNVAQPVPGRKVSENRGLYGNRIPSLSKHHTGGSATSAGSSGDVPRPRSVESKEVQSNVHESVPNPSSGQSEQEYPTSADLEENAVDMTDAPTRAREMIPADDSPETNSNPQGISVSEAVKPEIPIIRAEDLVPSTLPHKQDDNDVSSDVSEPGSPRSTAVQAALSDRSSVPALSRINSSLSVAATEQSSVSRGTLSSLRVETGGPEEDAERRNEASQQVLEDQDNLSDVSTPTGTPTMAPTQEHLPEIPSAQTHPIGGLSLHADGTVSPAAFGSGKKMPMGKHEDAMVDTAALPSETQKLQNEERVHELNPDATETEMNKKGNEAESQGDFQITDDNMVHIELPEDDPALTEEGRELQRLAKQKLHDEAEKRGKSEWQVMEDDSKDRPEHVKREQGNANEKETGDRHLSFEELEQQRHGEMKAKVGEKPSDKEESSRSAGNDQDSPRTPVDSRDFASSDKSATAPEPSSTTPGDGGDGDYGAEPESPLSNESREHMFDHATQYQDTVNKESTSTRDNAGKGVPETISESVKGLQTPSEVIEPPTPLSNSSETAGGTTKESASATSETRDESTTVEDITTPAAQESENVQDIEDIPTTDDTELHRKDQDPNVESLIFGKREEGSSGVQPKVEITEEDTVDDEAKQGVKSAAKDTPLQKEHQQHEAENEPVPQSPASVPSEIEEPLETDAKSNDNVASATFPSVPKQDPEIHEVSESQTPDAVSRTSTPASEGVKLPSVPKDDVDQDESAQGKVRVEVTLSPGKHLASHSLQANSVDRAEAGDADLKRFLTKKDGGVKVSEGAETQDTPSLDALAATSSNQAGSAQLAKSTSSTSTLSSSSSSSAKKKKSMERGRSPLLGMDTDGEDDGEAGWAKVSVNKTKYS